MREPEVGDTWGLKLSDKLPEEVCEVRQRDDRGRWLARDRTGQVWVLEPNEPIWRFIRSAEPKRTHIDPNDPQALQMLIEYHNSRVET